MRSGQRRPPGGYLGAYRLVYYVPAAAPAVERSPFLRRSRLLLMGMVKGRSSSPNSSIRSKRSPRRR
eukprot:4159207-Amphidinium_carterae.1